MGPREDTWRGLTPAPGNSAELHQVRLQPGGWRSCLSLSQPHTHGNGMSCGKSSCSASECFIVVPPSLDLLDPLSLWNSRHGSPTPWMIALPPTISFTANLCFPRYGVFVCFLPMLHALLLSLYFETISRLSDAIYPGPWPSLTRALSMSQEDLAF